MKDNEITYEEISKAVEKIVVDSKKHHQTPSTVVIEYKTLLYLIDRAELQQAEIEELAYKLDCLLCHATGGKLSKHTYPLEIMESYVNDTIQDYCEEAQAEAVKEFAERLKERATKGFWDSDAYIGTEQIDELAKEMVGDA